MGALQELVAGPNLTLEAAIVDYGFVRMAVYLAYEVHIHAPVSTYGWKLQTYGCSHSLFQVYP
jgi:hypothetical protein